MVLTAQQFREYVETHRDDIILKSFLRFASANMLTHVPNNKGKQIALIGSIKDEIVHRWKVLSESDFDQKTDIDVLEVESFRAQFRDFYVPEALENGWIGERRSSGQNPRDFPLEQFVLDIWVRAMYQFNERNLWQAVKDDNVDSGMALYNGFLQQVKTAITVGDLSPIALDQPYVAWDRQETIPAGFRNIIEIFETLYHDGVPEPVKNEGVEIYCSSKMFSDYNRAYRNLLGVKSPATEQLQRMTLDFSNAYAPATLHSVPGMGDSKRIIITPRRNMVYTYDVADDMTTFNFEQRFNKLFIWGTYRIGSKILVPNDDWMAVNELE